MGSWSGDLLKEVAVPKIVEIADHLSVAELEVASDGARTSGRGRTSKPYF
jgi:hypothetical protein